MPLPGRSSFSESCLHSTLLAALLHVWMITATIEAATELSVLMPNLSMLPCCYNIIVTNLWLSALRLVCAADLSGPVCKSAGTAQANPTSWLTDCRDLPTVAMLQHPG
jgi:hypothetical protein